jgi:hypothetical protein
MPRYRVLFGSLNVGGGKQYPAGSIIELDANDPIVTARHPVGEHAAVPFHPGNPPVETRAQVEFVPDDAA